MKIKGCLVIVGLLVLMAVVANIVNPTKPRPAQTAPDKADDVASAQPPTEQPTEQPATFDPNAPIVIRTLDATGQAIIATQAFFVAQQTQAASGQAVVTAAPAAIRVEQVAVQDRQAQTYYVQGSVNVRDCPRHDCAKVDFLVDGQGVAVDGQVEGEAIQASNATWYRINYGGRQGFVYSEYLTDQAPTAVPYVAPQPPTQPFSVAPVQNPNSAFTCNGLDDLNCGDFARDHGISAQQHLLQCGDEDNLDGDNDGRACEYGS